MFKNSNQNWHWMFEYLVMILPRIVYRPVREQTPWFYCTASDRSRELFILVDCGHCMKQFYTKVDWNPNRESVSNPLLSKSNDSTNFFRAVLLIKRLVAIYLWINTNQITHEYANICNDIFVRKSGIYFVTIPVSFSLYVTTIHAS